jgi:hypothetical protein
MILSCMIILIIWDIFIDIISFCLYNIGLLRVFAIFLSIIDTNYRGCSDNCNKNVVFNNFDTYFCGTYYLII